MQTLRSQLRAIPSITGQSPAFDSASAPEEPHELFLGWFRYALDAGVSEGHAATLSTVDEYGMPDARVLIVKDVTDDCDFKIATSDDSAKGHQLRQNSNCALTFYWSTLARSVRVRGSAHRASAAESAQDFLARQPQARAIALAGHQSSVLSSDAVREEAIARATAEIEADDSVVPADWGVWTIVPSSIEFWQGDPNRDHQRLRYTRLGAGWDRERLWS
ncbi:pyridoxine/pyridoxamine 5'-phosphate oxidase [Arthrobacter cryoconiti]|uniref:Pyridoxal 5'-phosphate synthase n=1 Tax=Arthrobacter cryoconiti TaxID=748907 RepID=A0ABV8R547_9MICC|nr:pyridoxal 5'-phosphate synthase [Arthrobacter cryoconiti]MCC9066862.1 pyridoxal 5'-phosphate synthase [Arthrobacter cryoconiti]